LLTWIISLGFGSVTMDDGRDAIKQVSMITSSTFDFAPVSWKLNFVALFF
jgi:hypothetical protein